MMPGEGSVLIVDDDIEIRELLFDYLEDNNLNVAAVENGEAMKAHIENEVPNVVLLDIHMPGEDGLTLAKYLRQNYSLGIIMVTGAGETVDRIVGLEVGADDYVAKPFDLRELLARIRSVLRRYETGNVSDASANSSASKVNLGSYLLDLDSHRLISNDGEEVKLTSMEYDLLRAFTKAPNRVLSRDDILNLTQSRDWDPYDRSIDIRIARIRQKIEQDPKHPQIIKTIRGAGYMFTPNED